MCARCSFAWCSAWVMNIPAGTAKSSPSSPRASPSRSVSTAPARNRSQVLASMAARSESTSRATASSLGHGYSDHAPVNRNKYPASELMMCRNVSMIEPYVPGTVASSACWSSPRQNSRSVPSPRRYARRDRAVYAPSTPLPPSVPDCVRTPTTTEGAPAATPIWSRIRAATQALRRPQNSKLTATVPGQREVRVRIT